MIDVISLIRQINATGNKLLELSDAEPTNEKPSTISVFTNYFETNSERDTDNFLKDMYGLK